MTNKKKTASHKKKPAKGGNPWLDLLLIASRIAVTTHSIIIYFRH